VKSRQKERKLFEELRQFDVPLDEAILENLATKYDDLAIGQSNAAFKNIIRRQSSGSLDVVINICIENRSSRNITIGSIRLTAPWLSYWFQWLPKQRAKIFSEVLGLHARVVVVNDRLPNCRIRPGDALAGLLIGEGAGWVPDQFEDQCKIPVKLTVFTNTNQEFSSAIELSLTREE